MLRGLLRYLVVCAALAGWCAAAAGQDKALGVEAKGGLLEKMMLLELNKVRAAAGKPALQLDDRISQLAREIVGQWAGGEIPNTSEAVRGQRAIARAAILRAAYGEQTEIEENFQPSGTPNSTVKTWMTHERERGRMLGDFTHVGIGIAADASGEGYYGVIFVTPRSNSLPAGQPSAPAPRPMPAPMLVTLTIENHTTGPIRFSSVVGTTEGDAGVLEAGRSIKSETIPGSLYIARDAAGNELRRIVVGAEPATIRFGQPGSPPAAPAQPSTTPPLPPQPTVGPRPAEVVIITLTNQTAETIELFWINGTVEEPAGRLGAGKTVKGDLPAGQNYVIRNQAKRELRRFSTSATAVVTIADSSSPQLPPSPTQPTPSLPTPSNPPQPPQRPALVGGKYSAMSREELEAEVVKEINILRQQAGVGPLTLDERVTKIARTYSDDVAGSPERLEQISRSPGPLGADKEPQGHWNMHLRGAAVFQQFGARTLFRENVMSTGSPESVAKAWFGSPGHNLNMLHPQVKLAGVAIGVRADGMLFYTAIFVNPQHPLGVVRTPLTDDERRQLLGEAVSRLDAARTAAGAAKRLTPQAVLTAQAAQWAESVAANKPTDASKLSGATAANGLVDKSGYRYRDIAETAGADVNSEELITGWLKNDGVKAWLLKSPADLEYGLGVSRGDDGKLYWSLIMAVP